jgi:type I restriction enzyme S subunit
MKLGELLKVQNGFAFDSNLFSFETGMQLIRIRDLKDGRRTETKYTGNFKPEYIVKKGDFLIGMDGEFRCAEWLGEPSLLNQRVCRLLDFDDRLDRRFLYYGINKFLKDIEDVTSFATVKHISSRQILRIEFPLPPLDEQKRIVAKLDEALGDLDRLLLIESKASLESQSLSRLLRSRAFEPEDSEGINFHQKRFGDLVTLIRGPFGGSITKKMFVEKGFAVYEQKHAIRNQFSEFRYFITQEKYEELERFAVSPGDLIMSCAGTIGEVAQVPDGSPPGVINQALMLIKPSAEIYSGYIKKYLMSATFQKALQEGAKGSALKNAASVSTLKEINIPLPSLADQERIVKALDDTEVLFAAGQECRVARKNELDRLRKAMFKSAFTGEF